MKEKFNINSFLVHFLDEVMPTINNAVIPMDVDSKNKSNPINAMLLRAWRERWTDSQWGTHIKTVNRN